LATQNLANTAYRWGSSSYNSSTDIKVGKTGSTSSDGTKYRGYIRFPALDSTWVIKSIKLVVKRIDSYSAHTLSFGVSSSNAWGATRDWSKNYSISSGTNNKTLDITECKSIVQGYGSTWYVHILHGSGSNSYTEFDGTSGTPYLVVEYEFATVYYHVGGAWQTCLVYYHNGAGWLQCIPYYNSGGTWVQV
jgi:hypothetical protein